MGYLIVFAGAGLGGALRHGVNLASARLFGVGFPYGTMIANIVGSLAMGLLAGYFLARTGIPQHVRLFVTTGVLGGFSIAAITWRIHQRSLQWELVHLRRGRERAAERA